jgi:hypothetical protein
MEMIERVGEKEMTDMIEKVAKAINDAMLQHGDYKPDELARAAIAAMREPTEDMIMASPYYQMPLMIYGLEYRAMIDAALEETKSTTKGELA